MEASLGTTEQNPCMQGTSEIPVTWDEQLSLSSLRSENLERLTVKVGTLGLQSFRQNRFGAAKKRARNAKLFETPTGDSNSCQTQIPRSNQPQNLQKPCTSEAQRKVKKRKKRKPSSTGPESSESRGHLNGPDKRQRPFGGTPEGGQTKSLKQVGK